MFKSVEAIVEPGDHIRLKESLKVKSRRRAIVTLLDEESLEVDEVTLLSEAALADWLRPEEDEAWAYLQKGR